MKKLLFIVTAGILISPFLNLTAMEQPVGPIESYLATLPVLHITEVLCVG